jgi:nitrous oxidase accessory protein NosD
MWVYRRIGHILWKEKKTESSARKIWNEARIIERCEDSTTEILQTYKRYDSLLKNILEGRVEGKRARGRQRYIWENNIKRWTGNSLTECTNGTRGRQRYIWENNIKRWTGNSLTECTNGTRDRQR